MRIARTSALAVAAPIVAALALVLALGARAERPLGVHSLNGTYHYAVVQIRQEAEPVPTTVYCNEYGRLSFDGAGSAHLVADSGYGVCSDGPNPFEAQNFTYTVDAAGSVMIIDDEPDLYTTHCQLLDKGALLICDGTGGTGPDANRNPELLVFSATAGKL